MRKCENVKKNENVYNLRKCRKMYIMCECWKHIGNTETNIKNILKKLNKNYDIMESLNINGKDVNAMNRRGNDAIFHISR